MFQALPGLRGFWPCSSLRYTLGNQVADLSAQQNDLTNVGPCWFGSEDLAPVVAFSGFNQYLTRADGGVGNWGDILGTEAFILPADRGMTFGGWFKLDSDSSGARQAIYTKGNGGVAATSWWLELQNTDILLLQVGTGAALPAIADSQAVTFDEWLFLVGRFIPSTSLDLIVGENGLRTASQGAGIPAALLDTNISVDIASYAAGTGLFMEGYASMLFLCATALPDVAIFSLYEQSRRLFFV